MITISKKTLYPTAPFSGAYYGFPRAIANIFGATHGNRDDKTMVRFTFLAAVSILFIAACAPVQESRETGDRMEIVFPPPPETPRFYFERTLSGSADIEPVDTETRWRRMLTGETVTTVRLSKPFDVEACQGKVYVSDTVSRVVVVFDVPRGEFSQIGSTEPGALTKPLGMATDADCNLYVADGTASRIVVYDQNGQFLRALGGKALFDRLSHVEVDPEGERVFAVDTGGVQSQRHHIRVLDGMTGEHLYDISKRGHEDGELNLPRDIALNTDGNLYVVDGGNFRVQVFTTEGEYVRKIGGIGVRTGEFSRPKGIDTDSDGNVYVSDAAFGNFQIFDPSGQLLLFVGDRSETPDPAKFMLPAGLAIDEDDRVYMVDQFFRKVDVFRPARLRSVEGYLGSRVDPQN